MCLPSAQRLLVSVMRSSMCSVCMARWVLRGLSRSSGYVVCAWIIRNDGADGGMCNIQFRCLMREMSVGQLAELV